MAVTQLAVLFIGLMAFLATLMFFLPFPEPYTAVLVEFAAAMLWGLFALSAFDVIVRDASFATASEPIWPLVFLGVGMALATFLLALHDLFSGAMETAASTDLEGFGP